MLHGGSRGRLNTVGIYPQISDDMDLNIRSMLGFGSKKSCHGRLTRNSEFFYHYIFTNNSGKVYVQYANEGRRSRVMTCFVMRK